MKLPLNTLLIALALGLALGQASPATAADAAAAEQLEALQGVTEDAELVW